MLNRRRFLGYTGLAALAVGCRPPRASPAAAPLPAPPVRRAARPDLQSLASLRRDKDLLLGYPINMNVPPPAFFAWRKQLLDAGIGQFAYNNVGNPQEHSHIPFNTHALERQVIDRFAALYRFSPDDAWGFLSHSGTDSNMHGMYMGRTVLSSRSGATPMLYYTPEAHYSIEVLRDLLGLDAVAVGTLADGQMDPEDLRRRMAENPDRPALIVATVGTTFKGAVDSIDAINAARADRTSYLHVDAALFGGYLPHTAFAAELAQRNAAGAPRYDSLAVSCHKFFGFPSPAGLFIARRGLFEEFLERFSQVHNPEYILQVPGTITCSRDAVKPAEFHFFTTSDAFELQRADAREILRDTEYLLTEMRSRVPELQPVRANALSNTVYFRAPSDAVVARYSLATMRVETDGAYVPHAHVVVMPHAVRDILDRFLADLELDARGQRITGGTGT